MHILSWAHDASNDGVHSSNAGGYSAGKQQQKRIVVTKEIGPSNSQLAYAAVTGELLKNVTIECINMNGGSECAYLTVKMTNAHITAINPQALVSNAIVKRGQSLTFDYETIQWVYVPIEQTHATGQTTHGGDQLSRG